METFGLEIFNLLPSAAVLIGPATLALVLLTGFAANVLQWVEDLAYRWETRPAFRRPTAQRYRTNVRFELENIR